MVQTEAQYVCIHQCLLAVLEGKENIISPIREIHDNQGYEGRNITFILQKFSVFVTINKKSRLASYLFYHIIINISQISC